MYLASFVSSTPPKAPNVESMRRIMAPTQTFEPVKYLTNKNIDPSQCYKNLFAR